MIFCNLTKILSTSNQISHRLFLHMTKNMNNILKPPQNVYLMKKLDKNAFEQPITVPVISFEKNKLSLILPLIKKYLLKLKNFKSIQHEISNSVSVYLNPEIVHNKSSEYSDVKNTLQKLNISEDNLKVKDFTLRYEHYSSDDVLQAILPKEVEGFSSYTIVGHILQVNLREHLLPYKDIIGQVLLDKVPGCKSVVNKTSNIDNTYRNFQMEVLKGDTNMLAKVKENNCRFEFDFSTVYWNSRLSTEHERIVKTLKPNDVLFDVFTGVGPFSIPTAKKQGRVFANDLNPESFKWLLHNKKLNKISDEYFTGFNLDGRDFISTLVKEQLPKYIANHDVFIVMNLPAMAVEFLDAFIGLFKYEELSDNFKPVTLFVYCFAKGEDPESIARNLVLENMKLSSVDVNSKISNIFRVRTVSSMKEMMRVTLSLDRDILVGSGNKRSIEGDRGKESKKICSRSIEVDKDGQEQKEIQQCLQSGGCQESKNES